MRTADALKIGMALGRIGATLDAWEESKHPRRPDGKFGSGGGGGKTSNPDKKSTHWYDKKKERNDEAVKKFKERIKTGNISAKQKRDLAEGQKMVESGEWTKNDYERQIRGIAISELEQEDYNKRQKK